MVGSRSFPRLDLVESFVDGLPAGTVLVSGGALGVDQVAAARARARGLEVVEHLPDLTGCLKRFEFTRRFYERNERIVADADELVAFTERDSGGTWDTIRRAQARGLEVKVVRTGAD